MEPFMPHEGREHADSTLEAGVYPRQDSGRHTFAHAVPVVPLIELVDVRDLERDQRVRERLCGGGDVGELVVERGIEGESAKRPKRLCALGHVR